MGQEICRSRDAIKLVLDVKVIVSAHVAQLNRTSPRHNHESRFSFRMVWAFCLLLEDSVQPVIVLLHGQVADRELKTD